MRAQPIRLSLDDGSAFRSRAFDAWAADRSIELLFIQPRKPIQNSRIESFNGRLRDEYLNQHCFLSLRDAQFHIGRWRRSHNTDRPLVSCFPLTPHEYGGDVPFTQRPIVCLELENGRGYPQHNVDSLYRYWNDMTPILVPTTSAEDWKSLLAKPDLHWKLGYSAMTLARAWEASRTRGFPPEVDAMLRTSGRLDWNAVRLLLAIPEYQVPLPGGERPSQTDLMVLARGAGGLVAIAVEGKVDESLGPTVGEKRAERSAGVDKRLRYLQDTLELLSFPDETRYQLLHRTVSALVVAHDFAAESAVMLVHSFSPTGKWFEDFSAFVKLFGQEAEVGRLVSVGKRGGVPLYVGWCVGDQQFRAESTPGAV